MLLALRGWKRTTGVPGATDCIGKPVPPAGPVAGGVGVDIPEGVGAGSGRVGWFGS
jgi:hypothetical protein